MRTQGLIGGGMWRRLFAIIGSAVFLFIAPGTIAGLGPWWISRWNVQEPLLGWVAIRWCGALLIGLGVSVILETFARFAWYGQGTPAPVFPTERLVANGLYRYVRNPMYWGVVTTILGQGFLLGDVRVLAYGAFVWVAVHMFVLVYEEPTLLRSYGTEYEEYCAAVPRWLPRTQAWRSSSSQQLPRTGPDRYHSPRLSGEGGRRR